MTRYDYTNYEQLLNSFDYKADPFNPHDEIFKQYIEILQDFNPIKNPPKKREEKKYIYDYIVPILQEYCRDFLAILEIDEDPKGITICIIADSILILKENTDLWQIIYYAKLFSVNTVNNKIKIELYFETNK